MNFIGFSLLLRHRLWAVHRRCRSHGPIPDIGSARLSELALSARPQTSGFVRGGLLDPTETIAEGKLVRSAPRSVSLSNDDSSRPGWASHGGPPNERRLDHRPRRPVPHRHAGQPVRDDPRRPRSQPPEYFAGSFQSVAWAISSGPGLLVAHVVLGLLLGMGSLALIVRVRALGRRRLTVAATLGFLFIVGADFNGASFLDFNEDYSSMIMATLFAAALLCYVGILSWLAEASWLGGRRTKVHRAAPFSPSRRSGPTRTLVA